MISVIVPIYNVEKYLNRCIDSILNQSFKDFELILVDDGSPDNCGKICDEYAKKDSRIVVIHKENGGLSDARNKGIEWAFENSKSEWITFIDSDDWVHRDYLKMLLGSAVELGSNVSACAYIETEKYLEDKSDDVIAKQIDTEEFYVTRNVNAVISCAKLYKKDLFIHIRFPFGKIHEDEFTTYKVLFQCKNIAYVSNPLYYYFQRSDSIMGREWNSKRLDALRAYEESARYFRVNKFLNAHTLCCWNGVRLANGTLNYKTAYTTKSDRNFLRKKLRWFLSEYSKITNKKIYELPVYYETAYPHLIKLYWLYRGLIH